VTALAFVARRVALLALVLVAVSMLTFGIVHVLPGDVTAAILGDFGTPEQAAALRQRLGLDQKLAARYAAWALGLLRGEFGTSLQHGQPIAPMLAGRLGNSAILGALVLGIGVPLAVTLGIVSALRPGGWLDRGIAALSVLAHAVPDYVIGLALILVFAIWWPLLPGSSLVDPDASPLARPEALVLPVAALVAAMLAHLGQVTRAAMLQALAMPCARMAVLKGLPPARVVLKHALPNAALPVVAEIGMHLGYVIGGIVVIEALFSYAGLGQMMVQAVAYRDVPVIQAAVMVVAAAYGAGNLLADLAALLIDPRLRA